MTDQISHNDDGDFALPPTCELLDTLLREWHTENADRANAMRDELLAKLQTKSRQRKPSNAANEKRLPTRVTARPAWRLTLSRFSPAMAAMIVLSATIGLFITGVGRRSDARADVIMAPNGGRLDAVDTHGQLIGPCPLKHTDVDVSVSGPFARVTLKQRYANPYADKIEAVYTFPLSHRAAVDRMTMTIGDRVMVGEVKERQQARAIYQAARAAGNVAGLLEQERPNIFTQSVANIEPGVEIVVEISYVELLEARDGVFGFAFPMVVAPRYIPGDPSSEGDALGSALPTGLTARQGLALLGPAQATITANGDTKTVGALDANKLTTALTRATAIDVPQGAWWSHYGPTGQPVIWHQFEIAYADGTKETGVVYTDGTGQLGNRWFYIDPQNATGTDGASGTGFANNTTQVPDAARITPMPVRPPTRAGHDISIAVNIDTGGPGIVDLASESHEIAQTISGCLREVALVLKDATTIPNKDFVLHWRETADAITEQIFTHADANGGFLTLILNPPARVADDQAVPRELVFVLDTSGSMSGFPIEKAKEVMSKAIAALRPQDTFNLITFAGDTHVLWDRPQPASADRLAEAQKFLADRQGSGGTEMMTAINAALEVKPPDGQAAEPDQVTPRELAKLPADGRTVEMRIAANRCKVMLQDGVAPAGLDIPASEGVDISAQIRYWTIASGSSFDPTSAEPILLRGQWVTQHEKRIFDVDSAQWPAPSSTRPMRVVCFMTDGEVGNDMAIIDAVKKNAKTSRVFSFGIGNSVNRYLLDSIAQAGHGAAEYVLLAENADEKVAAFGKRIQSPVLSDIHLDFSEGLEVVDRVPAEILDLWDESPIILHARFSKSGKGTVTIHGNAGSGPYDRSIELELPAAQAEHDVIATLWARAKVEQIMNRDLAAAQAGNFPPELRQQVVTLGETFQIMTQFTSFVAVENLRVTLGGQSRLVPVPIELPDGQSWEGTMGQAMNAWADRLATASAPKIDKDKNAESGDLYLSADVLYSVSAANSTEGIAVYHLHHKSAADLAFTLEEVLKSSDGKGPALDEGPDTHTLIAQGLKPEQRESVRKLVEMFDTPPEFSESDTVVALDAKDIPADALARVVKQAGEDRLPKAPGAQAPINEPPAAGLESNGLVIRASPSTIPVPNADVLVESEEALNPAHMDALHPTNWATVRAARSAGTAAPQPAEHDADGSTTAHMYSFSGGASPVRWQGGGSPPAPSAGQVGSGGGPQSTYWSDARSPAPSGNSVSSYSVGAPMTATASYGVPAPSVDMRTLVRANNTTPKQFNCPSTTNTPDPAQDTTAVYNFMTDLHLSYGYQSPPDPGRPLAGSADPAFPVMADANPYVKAKVTAAGAAAVPESSNLSPEALEAINRRMSNAASSVSSAGEDAILVEAAPEDLRAMQDALRHLDESQIASHPAGTDRFRGSWFATNGPSITDGLDKSESASPAKSLSGVANSVIKESATGASAKTEYARITPELRTVLQSHFSGVAMNPAGEGNNVAITGSEKDIKQVRDIVEQLEPTAGSVVDGKHKNRSILECLEGMTPEKAKALIEQLQHRDRGESTAATPVDSTSAQAAPAVNNAQPTGPRVLVDQLLVRIAALVSAGQWQQAITLTQSLAQARPDNRSAAILLDTLKSGVLNDDYRRQVISAVAARAAGRLKALADATKTLVKRLDEPLLRLTTGDHSDAARKNLSIRDDAVLVSALVDDTGDARQKSLTGAGLAIASVSKSTHVVIGRVPTGSLAKLALADGVRRMQAISDAKSGTVHAITDTKC